MIWRREYSSNSEQTISAIHLANQLIYTEHDFCTIGRIQTANLARLHSQLIPSGKELQPTHRHDGKNSEF